MRASSQRHGLRSLVAVPLLREERAIGVLIVRRIEVRPFTDQQIALLETFADQAVIAIENARLFESSRRRTGQLAEASASTSRSSWRTCPTSCGRR